MSDKRCATCKHNNGARCELYKIHGPTACDAQYSGGEPHDSKEDNSADNFLRRATEVLAERGKNYDDGQERSMSKIVEAFNSITGHTLSERDGWLFMQVLKLVRLTTTEGYHRDSYEDNVAYAALMAESAAKNKNG